MKKFLFLLLCVAFLTSCARRVVVAEPATTNVVVVKTLPKQYRVVRVKGKRYYRWNGTHYRKTRRGYVAVRL